MLTSMSSFPSALNRLNRPHNLTLILRDVGKSPLKNIPYEIRDLNDRMVKSGVTDGQGQIKLVYQAGVRLNLYLQPLKQGKMQKYKEFTTQARDGSVVWTTSLLLAEAELKPEGDAGEYWRGTYEVKKGDTLTSIAKHYGTQVSTLLALNPSIKDKDEIAVGIVLRVPPNKQSNDRNSERRNPPKSKSADEPAKSSASTPSAVQTRPPESEVLPNQSAMPAQSNRTTSTQISVVPSAPTGSSSTGIQNQQVQQQRTPKVDVQPIRKVESSNREGNSVTTLTPECVCKQSQLIWGSKVNCAFRKKVVEISKRINCDPNDLMAVMAVETGRSFLPYQLSNKKGHPQPKSASEVTESMVASRAVGLIQFTRSAVDELNAQLSKSGKASISKLKLARMSAVEQLDYVELHIKTAADRHMKGKRLTLSDLYTSVFAPAHMGKGEDAVLYHSGTQAYSANQSVDIGDGRGGKPDGKITKAELAKRTSDLKQEGTNHYSNYSDHEVERVPTTIAQAQTAKSNGTNKRSECKDGCSVVGTSALTVSENLAPWMPIAIREAKQWSGVSEAKIEDNYHALVGWAIPELRNMVGTKRAWCASFVNYCLQESGYTKWKTAPQAKAILNDSNFTQISKPIYGAIALYSTSHVCFVLATLPNNPNRFIRLGGNQGDQITCEERSVSGYRFFVPKAYKTIADKQSIAPAKTLSDVQRMGLPIANSKSTR